MRIDITLSADSFLNAAEQLKKYADSLQSKSETLVQRLGDLGAERAVNYLEHEATGETRNSIQFERKGNEGAVSVGGAAVWIEFGTGIVANKCAPGAYVHDKAAELGMCAIGTYDKGHGADPNGWWYPSEKGWIHTFGIESNPFMYLASQDMRKELLDMAKGVFKSD